MVDDAEAASVGTPAPLPDPDRPGGFPPDDRPGVDPTIDGGAANVLTRFLSRSPLLDLYERSGTGHKGAFWVCFTVDAVLRLVAAIVILAILIAVAWKTLAPLPRFWE